MKKRKGRHFQRFFDSENGGSNEKMLYMRASVCGIYAWYIIPQEHFPKIQRTLSENQFVHKLPLPRGVC